MAEQLSQLLLGVGVALGESDRWIWKVGGLQSFTVSSAYNLVKKDNEADPLSVFSKLWRCKSVPTAVLMAWRVLENKFATKVNLSRRGM